MAPTLMQILARNLYHVYHKSRSTLDREFTLNYDIEEVFGLK